MRRLSSYFRFDRFANLLLLANGCGRIKMAAISKLKIETGNAASVSAPLLHPPQARACLVFAHGAGAGMTHPHQIKRAFRPASRRSARKPAGLHRPDNARPHPPRW
jgi:hypothetical protein